MTTERTKQALGPRDAAPRPPSASSPRRRERLPSSCMTQQTKPLADILQRRLVGQEAVLDALTCAFPRVLSGLRDSSRPALTLLLLGPTGVGKTETARALAQALFGSDRALLRINSEEYANGHEISKLLGAPPGYVGHTIEPLLSQRRLDAPYVEAIVERRGLVGEAAEGRVEDSAGTLKGAFSVVLFDEIEKAHPVLWNAMLGILEDGKLTLGDNSTTDFTRSIVVMTSNVGSRPMSELVERRPVGFGSANMHRGPVPGLLTETALAAARSVFPLEFLNRFDHTLVYSTLERRHLHRIFEKFLAEIHVRAIEQSGVPLLVQVSDDAREIVIDRGTDLIYGARPLRRAMETELVDPLSRLIAAGRLGPGDIVEVERDGDELAFYRNPAPVPTVRREKESDSMEEIPATDLQTAG